MTQLVLALMLGGAADTFRDWRCESEQRTWAKFNLPAACEVGGSTREERVSRLASAWKIEPLHASCAIEAFDAEREMEDEAWLRCLLRSPTTIPFWVRPLRTRLQPQVFELLVEELRSRGTRGREVIRQVALFQFAPPALVVAAWRNEPSRLVELIHHPLLSDQAAAALSSAASEHFETLDEASQLAVIDVLLAHAIDSNAALWSAERFLQLAPGQRRRLVDSCKNGCRVDLVKLALAVIAAGRREIAVEMNVQKPSRSGFRDRPFLSELLEFRLTGKRAQNPWDASIAAEGSMGDAALISVALPYISPHEAMLADATRWLSMELEPESNDPFVASLNAARLRALALLPSSLARKSPRRAPVVTPSELPAPWKERGRAWSGQRNTPFVATPPSDHVVIRAERDGKRIVALSLSQRLDPVGEVSHGALWLIISADNGLSWREVYLGLGDFRPFHLHETSAVPIIDGDDVVRIEVQDAPLEEASISFPPIATQRVVKRERVILEAPLASLVRDSDGDGLSDLVERRLLLDPTRADTDGDGVSDVVDRTPRLDDRAPATVTAEMLNAFFALEYGGPRAIVIPPGASGAQMPNASSAQPCRFLIGDAKTLGGLKPHATLITITDDELEQAVKTFGSFYPIDLTIVLNGKDHAYIRYSEGWRGGSLRIDRDATGGLIITSLGSWIS